MEKKVRAAEIVQPNYNPFTCTQSMRTGQVPVQNGCDDDTKMCEFRKKITFQIRSELFIFYICGDSLSFTPRIARITIDFREDVRKKYLGPGHNGGCQFHIRSDEASSGANLFLDMAAEIDQHPSNPLSKYLQIIIDRGRMCAEQI